MRILYVSDVFHPRVNGVSTSIATFREELTRLGHDVQVVAPEYPGTRRDPPWLRRAPSRRVPFDPEDRWMRGDALRALLPRLRTEAFDLLHVQTPFVAHGAGIRLARELGVPVIGTCHTHFEQYLGHYVPFLPDALLAALARRLTRRQTRQLDALVVPSHPMAEVLRGYGVSTSMTVIPTGIALRDLRPGNPASFRERHGIAPGRPTLVHVGRLAHEKNVEFLLRALVRVHSEVPDVALIIAGEGPALPRLRRLTAELRLDRHVVFVPYLDRQRELPSCYQAGDAFVFASRTETQGLVLLEAMALGVPVVSTAILGTRDLLGPRRGALVAPEDETLFAAQVTRLLRSPALRRRLSAEARDVASGWSAERQAMRLLGLYREVIDAKVRGWKTGALTPIPLPLGEVR